MEQTVFTFFSAATRINPYLIMSIPIASRLVSSSAFDGTAWVTNSGGIDGKDHRSVAKFALVNGTLQRLLDHTLQGEALKGLALDSQGNAWITSQGNSTIYGIRPDGTRIGRFTGGGIDGPWGIAVDGEDKPVGRQFRTAPRAHKQFHLWQDLGALRC